MKVGPVMPPTAKIVNRHNPGISCPDIFVKAVNPALYNVLGMLRSIVLSRCALMNLAIISKDIFEYILRFWFSNFGLDCCQCRYRCCSERVSSSVIGSSSSPLSSCFFLMDISFSIFLVQVHLDMFVWSKIVSKLQWLLCNCTEILECMATFLWEIGAEFWKG